MTHDPQFREATRLPKLYGTVDCLESRQKRGEFFAHGRRLFLLHMLHALASREVGGRRPRPIEIPRRYTLLHPTPVITQSVPIMAARITALPHRDEHMFYTSDGSGRVKFGRAGTDGMNSCNITTLQLHRNAIFDVLVPSYEGDPTSRIVTAAADGTCGIFELQGGVRRVATLRGQTLSVKKIAQRPGSLTYFATAGRDGRVLQWDVRAPKAVSQSEPEGAAVAATPSFLVASASLEDAHAAAPSLLGARSRPPPKRSRSGAPMAAPAPAVTCVEFCTEHLLASAGADGTVRLWDARCGVGAVQLRAGTKVAAGAAAHPLHTLLRPSARGLYRGVSTLSASTNGTRLLVAAVDSVLSVYTLANCAAPPVQLSGHLARSFYARGACLSPDGTTAAAGGEDGHLYLWEVASPSQPPLVLRSSAVRPGEPSGADAGTDAGGWPSAPGSAAERLDASLEPRGSGTEEICCLDWARRSCTGDWLVSGSDDGVVRVWSVQPDRGLAPTAEPAKPCVPTLPMSLLFMPTPTPLPLLSTPLLSTPVPTLRAEPAAAAFPTPVAPASAAATATAAAASSAASSSAASFSTATAASSAASSGTAAAPRHLLTAFFLPSSRRATTPPRPLAPNPRRSKASARLAELEELLSHDAWDPVPGREALWNEAAWLLREYPQLRTCLTLPADAAPELPPELDPARPLPKAGRYAHHGAHRTGASASGSSSSSSSSSSDARMRRPLPR